MGVSEEMGGENPPDFVRAFVPRNRRCFLPLFPTQEGGEGRGEEFFPEWSLSPALSWACFEKTDGENGAFG
jgi:hypothetical protein